MNASTKKGRAGPAGITIGRLAKAADVSVETIRYYERCGLLRRPRRQGRAYRRYPPSAVEHIRFIKRVQSLGFSLEQIRALLDLDNDGAGSADTTEAYLLQEVQRRVADLRALEAALKTRNRNRGRGFRPPPIVGTLKPQIGRKA